MFPMKFNVQPFIRSWLCAVMGRFFLLCRIHYSLLTSAGGKSGPRGNVNKNDDHLCSKLIIEIIDMILQDVGPDRLQSLLTVNSFFTLRRPYHTVVLHSLTNSINLFRTLRRNQLPNLNPSPNMSRDLFRRTSNAIFFCSTSPSDHDVIIAGKTLHVAQ